MSEKSNAAKEITVLVESFCRQYFDEELTACAHRLCETLSRKCKLNIARGRKEIWAAAIICIIARQNFLFDKANPCFLTVETICDFFDTKKTTVNNKARLVEDACDIGFAEPDYCTREIGEAFSFLEQPDGLIIPARMSADITFERANEEESKEIEKFFEEVMRQEKEALAARRERRTEINREIAENKKRKKREHDTFRQPGLFED